MCFGIKYATIGVSDDQLNVIQRERSNYTYKAFAKNHLRPSRRGFSFLGICFRRIIPPGQTADVVQIPILKIIIAVKNFFIVPLLLFCLLIAIECKGIKTIKHQQRNQRAQMCAFFNTLKYKQIETTKNQ
jgi:hypothetical protein